MHLRCLPIGEVSSQVHATTLCFPAEKYGLAEKDRELGNYGIELEKVVALNLSQNIKSGDVPVRAPDEVTFPPVLEANLSAD